MSLSSKPSSSLKRKHGGGGGGGSSSDDVIIRVIQPTIDVKTEHGMTVATALLSGSPQTVGMTFKYDEILHLLNEYTSRGQWERATAISHNNVWKYVFFMRYYALNERSITEIERVSSTPYWQTVERVTEHMLRDKRTQPSFQTGSKRYEMVEITDATGKRMKSRRYIERAGDDKVARGTTTFYKAWYEYKMRVLQNMRNAGQFTPLREVLPRTSNRETYVMNELFLVGTNTETLRRSNIYLLDDALLEENNVATGGPDPTYVVTLPPPHTDHEFQMTVLYQNHLVYISKAHTEITFDVHILNVVPRSNGQAGFQIQENAAANYTYTLQSIVLLDIQIVNRVVYVNYMNNNNNNSSQMFMETYPLDAPSKTDFIAGIEDLTVTNFEKVKVVRNSSGKKMNAMHQRVVDPIEGGFVDTIQLGHVAYKNHVPVLLGAQSVHLYDFYITMESTAVFIYTVTMSFGAGGDEHAYRSIDIRTVQGEGRGSTTFNLRVSYPRHRYIFSFQYLVFFEDVPREDNNTAFDIKFYSWDILKTVREFSLSTTAPDYTVTLEDINRAWPIVQRFNNTDYETAFRTAMDIVENDPAAFTDNDEEEFENMHDVDKEREMDKAARGLVDMMQSLRIEDIFMTAPSQVDGSMYAKVILEGEWDADTWGLAQDAHVLYIFKMIPIPAHHHHHMRFEYVDAPTNGVKPNYDDDFGYDSTTQVNDITVMERVEFIDAIEAYRNEYTVFANEYVLVDRTQMYDYSRTPAREKLKLVSAKYGGDI